MRLFFWPQAHSFLAQFLFDSEKNKKELSCASYLAPGRRGYKSSAADPSRTPTPVRAVRSIQLQPWSAVVPSTRRGFPVSTLGTCCSVGTHTPWNRVLASAGPVRQTAPQCWWGWVNGGENGETPSESTRRASDRHAVVWRACGQDPHKQGGVSPIEFARLSSVRDGVLTSSFYCSE